MIAYDTDFAALYDVFYGEKPYDDETAFVGRTLKELGAQPPGRLLDVACGTGQHAVRFAKAGWTVVGVDQSAAMLAAAMQRSIGLPLTFLQQDMAELDVSGPPFDAAVCLFDSIGYAITNERVLATLRGIRRHLRPGGVLVLEFWHAAAMLTSYEPRREREWSLDGETIRRVSQTSLDAARQVARVEYTVERRDVDGRLTGRSDELHENRFFLVQEMGLFLQTAGFEALDWCAGYDRDTAIDESTWHVLAVARARAGDT